MPMRIQRRRTKGWRKPRSAVHVGRPGYWGNPFIVGDLLNGGNISPQQAVDEFRSALLEHRLQFSPAEVHEHLRGRDLMCWCPLFQPCHADVLLEIANRDGGAV